jgi:CRP/FNR family transcriptional regulator, anaerobic regulatory protein
VRVFGGTSLGGSCLAERLGHHVALTGAEHAFLDRLEADRREYRRGAVIVSEGQPTRELFIVQKGWLQSSILLGNGGRQIMRIGLPGDLIGITALAYEEAPETVVALTDVMICPLDRDRLASLFAEHPRLGALLFAIAVAERTALADRLASVGRTPARARVAALLCDIFTRLRRMEGPRADGVHVPLTQEEIGDATGLTAVHVNRMVRGLVDDGIIERSGSVIRLLDEKRLAEEASFVDRLAVSTNWLPAAR